MRYSGNPVISSTPSNFHPRTFVRGSSRLYVSHPVNLWKGTSSSPSLATNGLSASQGHTSPKLTPPSTARVRGQIGASPSMSAPQSAATGTTRPPVESVIDCDSRKSTIPPGRASAPKKAGLAFSAVLRFCKRDVRPSRPTIGLAAVTCIADAVFCAVMRDKPSARGRMRIRNFGSEDTGIRTIGLVRVRAVTREEPVRKHIETRDA